MSNDHEKHDDHGGGGGGHGGGGHGHGGGGGHEEGHEGAPEWLISFADNVALMMGFFVILLAMNMAKKTSGGIGGEQKMGGTPETIEMIDFALAVREGFNNPVDPSSSDPKEQALVQRLIQRSGKSEARDPGLKGKEQDSQAIRPSNYHTECGNISFPENSTEVPEHGRVTIRDAAKKVKGVRLVVEVRGHVSSVEAQRGAEMAMHLSAERAQSVARSLAAEGVDWWQMRLVVCADHDRIEAYPTSKTADRANARVEIILTDEVVPDQVPTKYEESVAAPAQ
jgi:flagellar motor protein MotB